MEEELTPRRQGRKGRGGLDSKKVSHKGTKAQRPKGKSGKNYLHNETREEGGREKGKMEPVFII